MKRVEVTCGVVRQWAWGAVSKAPMAAIVWGLLGLLGTGNVTLCAAPLVLKVERGASPGSSLELQWPAVVGRRYEIWARTSWSVPWALMVPWEGWVARTNSVGVGLGAGGGERYFRVAEHRSAYDPIWAQVEPVRRVVLTNNPSATASVNGARLRSALVALVPGDMLEIAAGTYSIDSYFALDLQGTEALPIWVQAAGDGPVVITRPDANQNIINLGVNQESRYVCFRGLEFTGGSHGVRLYGCREVWVDQCRIHHTGDVGLSANARDTRGLHLTRNEIWSTGGTGEGMYLGGNNGSVIMSESVIALNHVHDTVEGVTQGDGIEVKQGSWGNWIAENHVHDCNYPCILVYGTAGQPANVVERNICYRSNDNAMQVQGESVVRNNLVMGGGGSAFASQPHQGNPTAMTVVHNTFINTGTAVRLSTWGGGTNMVFANNACYSQSGAALNVVNGFGSAVFAGNVRVGSVTAGVGGQVAGVGLGDYVDVSWDVARRDARPVAGSALLGAGVAAYAVTNDLTGAVRMAPWTAGCLQTAGP